MFDSVLNTPVGLLQNSHSEIFEESFLERPHIGVFLHQSGRVTVSSGNKL